MDSYSGESKQFSIREKRDKHSFQSIVFSFEMHPFIKTFPDVLITFFTCSRFANTSKPGRSTYYNIA